MARHTGNRPRLTLAELQRIQKLDERDPGSLWKAVSALVPRLDDRLIVVDNADLRLDRPDRIAIAQPRDAGKPAIIVVVSRAGWIKVMPSDGFGKQPAEARLEGFDPATQEIMTVALSRRLSGRRFDLWLGAKDRVTGEDKGPLQLFHGLVWTDDVGNPRISHSLDDAENGGAWRPRTPQKDAEWLTRWHLTIDSDHDLRQGLPAQVAKAVQRHESETGLAVTAICWRREALALAVGDRLVVFDLLSTPDIATGEHEFGEHIRCLAITRAESEGPIRGVVGLDGRRLIAFEMHGGHLHQIGEQVRHEFPAALAFVAQGTVKPPDGTYPRHQDVSNEDLVATYSDGQIERLRKIDGLSLQTTNDIAPDSTAIHHAWQDTWAKLGLVDIDALIASVQGRDHPPDATAALLQHAVDVVIDQGHLDPPERVSNLFRPREPLLVLGPALGVLTRRLLTATASDDDRAQACQLAAILEQVYEHASGRVRGHIDRKLASIGLDTLAESSDPSCQRLAMYARRTRIDIRENSPNSDLERIEHAAFELERWASALLRCHSHRISGDVHPQRVGSIAGIPDGKRGRLAVAVRERISLHAIGDRVALEPRPFAEYSLDKPICGLAYIGRGTLIALDRRATLFVLGTQGDQPEVESRLEISKDERARCLACCPAHGGGTMIAVVIGRAHAASLILVRARKNKLEPIGSFPLHQARAATVDIARTEDGYRLAVGADDEAPVELLRVDAAGAGFASQVFRTLRSGTMAVRFSAPVDPEFLAAGERDGLVWCASLEAQSGPVSDIAWIYQLDGAVRAIERLTVDGEPSFVIGSENCKLVLLSASDGRRLWKDRLQAPVRHLTVWSEGTPGLAAGMFGGWLSLFEPVSLEDRASALEMALADINQIADTALDDPELRADAQTVRAFRDFLRRHAKLEDSFLNQYQARETRARAIRAAVEQSPSLKLETADGWVRALNARDLMLLISYLGDQDRQFDSDLAAALRLLVPTKTSGDNSARALMAATATHLQRLARQGTPADRIVAAWPSRPQVANQRWVRLETARALIAAVDAETPTGSEISLSPLLSYILQLPPAIVPAMAAIVPTGTLLATDLDKFVELLGALPGERAGMLSSIHHLGTRLDSASNPCADLLAALFAFMRDLGDMMSEAEESSIAEAWAERRASTTSALDQLARAAYSASSPAGAEAPIRRVVRELLLAEPLAADRHRLEDRIERLSESDRHLRLSSEIPDNTDAWAVPRRHLMRHLRDAIQETFSLERTFLARLVRPRLELARAMRDIHGHVILSLEAVAEGQRELSDVTLVFDATDKGGLRGPGRRKDIKHEARYSRHSSRLRITLDGFVNANAKDVTVRATTIGGEGDRHKELWTFHVPELPQRQRGRFTFPEHLKRTYAHFRDTVLRAETPVQLAVIDPDLGAEVLIADWQSKHRQRTIDLDASLEDFGPNRVYGRFDGDLFDEKVIEEIAKEVPAKSRPRPYLIGPCSEALERLLRHDAGEALRWFQGLGELAGQHQVHLTVLISKRQALSLHTLRDHLPFHLAHRPVVDKRMSASPIVAEAVQAVSTECDTTEPQARRWLQELGMDRGLLLRWLTWRQRVENLHQQREGPAQFLASETVREQLQRELASLSVFELLTALAATHAETLVPLRSAEPGLVVAEDYRSTTRSRARQAKLLVARGEALSDEVISRLLSDQNPPHLLRIRGVGATTASTSTATRLIAVVQSRSHEERRRTFARLDSIGIGTEAGDILRTASPYRESILALYQEKDNGRGSDDAAVFEALLGHGRSPAEAITAEDVRRLPDKQLSALMPASEKADRRRLRRLALALVDAQASTTEAALKDAVADLRPLTFDSGSWFSRLTSLNLPLFGFGAAQGVELDTSEPEGFLLWLEDKTEASFVGRISQVVLEVIGMRAKLVQKLVEKGRARPQPQRTPPVYLLGPGAEHLPPDSDRRVAVLRFTDAVDAVWRGDLAQGLRQRARARLKLTAFSPFQTSGALEPGSSLFVGREQEIEFIRERVRRSSILIVGGRRVGKTSLLNHIGYWAQQEPDLLPIRADLQGVDSQKDFLSALKVDLRSAGTEVAQTIGKALEASGDDVRASLHAIADHAREHGATALFLFNEIDLLATREPKLLEIWRTLNDKGLARFVFVGYGVVAELGKLTSSLFHFTEGTAFDGRALVLGGLDRSPARELFGLLEKPPLALRWRTELERTQALDLLHNRSYGIPWVIQRFAHMLIEQVEKRGKDELTLDEVQHLLGEKGEGNIVWQYIDGIDFAGLESKTLDPANDWGFRLVLYALARKYYFLGNEALIRDPHLSDRDPLDTGFTDVDAREAVREVLPLMLFADERREVERWLERAELSHVLRLLTLSLALEPDRSQNGRYGFHLHIVPRELKRQRPEDPRLEDLIVDVADRLVKAIKKNRTNA